MPHNSSLVIKYVEILKLLKMQRLRTIIKPIASFLRWGDMFSTSQFLRYKGQTDYNTVTGGFVSLSVIIIFIALFTNIGLQTAKRELINSSVSFKSETDPSPIKIVAGPKGQFSFLIAILGLNLNNPAATFFDIRLTQYFYGPLRTLLNSTDVPLEQCTLKHFTFSDDTTSYFKKFSIQRTLCPPLNYEFNVGGRMTSQIFSQFQIKISKCNSTLNPKCASEVDIKDFQTKMGYFSLGMPFVTSLINTGDQQYAKYNVYQNSLFAFTIDSLAVAANGQIAQMQVDTDISLMPYTDIVTEYYIGFSQQFKVQSIPIINNTYAKISMTKASTYPIYTRSFNKVDDFLSYVGGLVSTSLLLFFIFSAYSAVAYTLQIAAHSFRITSEKSVPAGSFNFIHFILVGIKDLVTRFNKDASWPMIDEFRKCRNQAQKQLDISYILARINFLENVASTLMEKHQLLTLYIKKKPELDDIIRKKRNHRALKIIHKLSPQNKDNKEGFISNSVNQNSESPNKCPSDVQIQNNSCERGCIEDSSDSDNDENRQDMINQLQQAYQKLSNDQSNTLSAKILKGLDSQTLRRLKTPSKPTQKYEISIQNYNSLSFQEINGKPTEVNAHNTFEFIQ